MRVLGSASVRMREAEHCMVDTSIKLHCTEAHMSVSRETREACTTASTELWNAPFYIQNLYSDNSVGDHLIGPVSMFVTRPGRKLCHQLSKSCASVRSV